MAYRCTPNEAADCHLQVAAKIDAVDEALDDAFAFIISIIETYDFDSFTPDQRVMLKQWHTGVKEARIALRLPSL